MATSLAWDYFGSRTQFTSRVVLVVAAATTATSIAVLAASAYAASTTASPKNRPKRQSIIRVAGSFRAYLSGGLSSFSGDSKDKLDPSTSTARNLEASGKVSGQEVARDTKDNGESPQLQHLQDYTGLLLGDDLAEAVRTCKERVARISAECRADNRRFR